MLRTLLSAARRAVVRKRGHRHVNDKVCTVPFERFGVNADGSVELCCGAWMQGDILAGNVFHQSFWEVWNSSTAKEIRKSVTDGTFSRCTGKCPLLASGNLPRREDVRYLLREAVNNPTKDLRVYPQYVKLNNDYSCNLYCPSCRRDRFVADKNAADAISEANMRIIFPLLRHANVLDILGSGEVLASRASMELLNHLDAEIHRNLRIYLLTNGMLFDENGWDRLRAIHKLNVWLNLSIDAGTKDTYEKLRRGGVYEKLMENLRFIGQLRAGGTLKKLILNVTIQKDNYRELPLVAQLAREHHADQVMLFRLVNWGSFSEEECRDADVSRSDHPEHERFLQVLADDSLYDIIDIGPFAVFRQ